MAEPVPAGSDVSAGTYQCTNCGNTIDVGSTDIPVRHLTVRKPIVCSTAGMLVLILTMLVLLSSVLALSWLDRNALR